MHTYTGAWELPAYGKGHDDGTQLYAAVAAIKNIILLANARHLHNAIHIVLDNKHVHSSQRSVDVAIFGGELISDGQRSARCCFLI